MEIQAETPLRWPPPLLNEQQRSDTPSPTLNVTDSAGAWDRAPSWRWDTRGKKHKGVSDVHEHEDAAQRTQFTWAWCLRA
jgi:hypothetical protein